MRREHGGVEAEQVAVRLEAERAETLHRIAALAEDWAGVAAASAGANLDDEHDPEGSTVAFEREQLAAARARAHHHLGELDAALARLRDGSYGVCERCAGPIAAARLAALPAARWCVRCAAGMTR